jgi:hypothetical protein
MPVDLHDAVKLICLVYHEARNVRHPIKAKLIDGSGYERLMSLPKNRNEAWQHMSALRNRAANSATVEAATNEFERSLGLSLSELVAVYELPIWKHSPYGGNKWAGITSKVCELVHAMKTGADAPADDLYQAAISMCHNTGRLVDKLRNLGCI